MVPLLFHIYAEDMAAPSSASVLETAAGSGVVTRICHRSGARCALCGP